MEKSHPMPKIDLTSQAVGGYKMSIIVYFVLNYGRANFFQVKIIFVINISD